MKTRILFILICNLTVCNLQYSQNITNTLGSNGVFSLKDNSTTYLSLNQSSGYLYLNNSLVLPHTVNSTTGVMYKDIQRFLHNYQADGTDGVNTFLGLSSGNFTMSGTGIEASYNTGIGVNALYSLTTGNSNVALGVQSLFLNTTGNNNTAIGNSSLRANTGNFNTAVGSSSLYSNTTGQQNTAFGYQTLFSNTISHYNTAIGYQSLYSNSTGGNNTSVGNGSMYWNTTGGNNTAVGQNSLLSNITGYSNTSIGKSSLSSNTSGYNNTALGMGSLTRNTEGYNNIAIGYNSLYSNLTGYNNTAIGNKTGQDVLTGSNLTLIGYDAAPSSPSAANQITFGNYSVTSLRCNVQNITSLSDARDKKNISELTLGLDFITKLHPRQFNWDKREWYDNNVSDGSKMKDAPTAGFIAQELDSAQTTAGADWLNLVLKDNPDKWEATYGNLLPVMVKAIQELKSENDELKEKLAKFEEMQSVLAGEIEKIRSNNNETREVKLTGK